MGKVNARYTKLVCTSGVEVKSIPGIRVSGLFPLRSITRPF